MNKLLFLAVLIAAMVASYECATKCYSCALCGSSVGTESTCTGGGANAEYECYKSVQSVLTTETITKGCLVKGSCNANSVGNSAIVGSKFLCCGDDLCNFGYSNLKTSMVYNMLVLFSIILTVYVLRY